MDSGYLYAGGSSAARHLAYWRLALVVSAQEVFGLDERPSAELLEELGDGWRPWRSVAARILWHNYLSKPKRRGGDKPK